MKLFKKKVNPMKKIAIIAMMLCTTMFVAQPVQARGFLAGLFIGRNVQRNIQRNRFDDNRFVLDRNGNIVEVDRFGREIVRDRFGRRVVRRDNFVLSDRSLRIVEVPDFRQRDTIVVDRFGNVRNIEQRGDLVITRDRFGRIVDVDRIRRQPSVTIQLRRRN